METIKKIYSWFTGIFTALFILFVVIGWLYNIPDNTLYIRILRVATIVWVVDILTLVGYIIYDETLNY